LDVGFSDVSGVEIIKWIRRDERLKSTPIFVMLEEERNPPPREELISWGADQFVGKYRGIGGIADAVMLFLEGEEET